MLLSQRACGAKLAVALTAFMAVLAPFGLRQEHCG